MECISCNNKKFGIKKVRMETTFKDEPIEVITDTFVCTHCQHEMMNTEQMSAFRKTVSDVYRKKHSLLTSEEILAFRKKLSMSQIEFAKYLGVGDASIKRWESTHVQDESQNELIRLKCDEDYAIQNMLNIQWISTPADEYSGNKKFNLNMFVNLVLHLIKVTKSPLYLNKALFYVDFKNYQKYSKSITGARYVALDYGPCPDQFKEIFHYMEKNKLLSRSNKHDFSQLTKENLGIFDDRELETIQFVFELAKKDGGKYLFNQSHKEKAFIETPKCSEHISYLKSSNLLI